MIIDLELIVIGNEYYRLTQNLHTLKTAAVSNVIQGF